MLPFKWVIVVEVVVVEISINICLKSKIVKVVHHLDVILSKVFCDQCDLVLL